MCIVKNHLSLWDLFVCFYFVSERLQRKWFLPGKKTNGGNSCTGPPSGGLVCISVLSTLVTVWCILSQIALDCGFLLVEHTWLMLKISNSHWKFWPMNSHPLSCRHCTGQGYQQSQLCVNLSRMCLAVLLSMQISLTRFKAVLMQVNALISTCQPLTLTFHGPIKLMATSSQGAIHTSCLGRRP